MAQPRRGEVWLIDLGLAAKVRPCLLLTGFPADDELALVTVVPHTTAIRGNQWEHACQKAFLKAGAFHLQQVQSVSTGLFVALASWTPLKWRKSQRGWPADWDYTD
jgi:mRNA interferase MazF